MTGRERGDRGGPGGDARSPVPDGGQATTPEATDGLELNVATLGTFYEMAREGANLAAGRLTGMADVPTRVGVTRLNFMHGAEFRSTLADGRPRVGVQVELSGGFEGSTLILFDSDSADRVTERLRDVPQEGVEDMSRSTITELCHVMNAGYVDGWADVLDVAIDVSPPTYVAGSEPETLLAGLGTTPADDDLALLFQSRIETVGAEIEFDHYLLPESDTIADLVRRRQAAGGADGDGDGGQAGIQYHKLLGFDRMAERGADEVADSLTTMTGIDMDVDIRRINFISLDTIPEEIPNEELVSVAFNFSGTPSGYLVFVFDLESVHALVEATLPGAGASGGGDEDGDIGEMGRDAISEFGNVMASGFIDGWANVLDTTIEHTPPEYTRDLGAAVVDPLVIGLSERQEFAFVFDTAIVAEDRSIDVSAYAIPDEADLERALAALDLSRVDSAPTKAEFDVAAVERDESAVDASDLR